MLRESERRFRDARPSRSQFKPPRYQWRMQVSEIDFRIARANHPVRYSIKIARRAHEMQQKKRERIQQHRLAFDLFFSCIARWPSCRCCCRYVVSCLLSKLLKIHRKVERRESFSRFFSDVNLPTSPLHLSRGAWFVDRLKRLVCKRDAAQKVFEKINLLKMFGLVSIH